VSTCQNWPPSRSPRSRGDGYVAGDSVSNDPVCTDEERSTESR
jgi:hypothetical protein